MEKFERGMEAQLSEKPFSAIYTAYSISFDGKNIVHLKFTDFLNSGVEEWINFFGAHPQSPTINVHCGDNGLDLAAIDKLAPNESWENRLRLHHALGKSFFETGNPTYPYESFHSGLLLEKYNLPEFLNAWEAESIEMGQNDLREALSKSPDHIKLFRFGNRGQGYYFKKTPFVLEQLPIASEKRKSIEIAATKAKEVEEAAKAQAEIEATEAAARRRVERIGTLSTRRPSAPAYTIFLSPGIVRYVSLTAFLNCGIDKWIELIRNHTTKPIIKTPSINPYDFNGVDLERLDLIFPELPWDERLRLHYKFGRLKIEQGVPTIIYCAFHSGLALQKLELEACLEAWIKEAWENHDVAASYIDSPNHFIIAENPRFVFVKTPFVSNRLAALGEHAEKEREREMGSRVLEEKERLRRSRFNTFIYVMEDLRNGLFKIGRSSTPEKRERTLQSEVPQVQMRVSIPGEEKHEKELHENFFKKRIRGEWFSLNADDLVRVVSFLKQNGDTDRVWLDSEWFGKICFQANPKEKP